MKRYSIQYMKYIQQQQSPVFGNIFLFYCHIFKFVFCVSPEYGLIEYLDFLIRQKLTEPWTFLLNLPVILTNVNEFPL